MNAFDLYVKSNIDGQADVPMRLFAEQSSEETIAYISALKRDDAIRFCSVRGWKLIDWNEME